jgi:hypothetical protein
LQIYLATFGLEPFNQLRIDVSDADDRIALFYRGTVADIPFFDPARHQAISLVPADQPTNTVVTVLQKGSLIAERVLRPALVTVAAPK